MEALDKINKQIFNCRKQERYAEALDFYKNYVHNKIPLYKILENDYLIANVLHCLRKTSKPSAALIFYLKNLKLSPNWQKMPHATFEYGWCLYQQIKSIGNNDFFNGTPDFILKAIEFHKTINHSEQYLLYSLMFFELSKKMMQKGEPVKKLIELIEEIPESHFSANNENSLNIDRKQKIKASDFESFLVRKAKAYFLDARFDDCIKACDSAFNKIKKFHHGNHIWLSRNMALSLKQTGKTDEAIERMEKIVSKKKDWFLLHELANIYKYVRKEDYSTYYFCKAAIQNGHSSYKATLYEEMASIFQKSTDNKLICMHLSLALKTREEQSWKIPGSLFKSHKEHNCSVTEKSSSGIYAILEKHWYEKLKEITVDKTAASHDVLEADGKITRILNQGVNGDGFITTNDGASIYFRFKKARISFEKLSENTNVKVFAKKRSYKGKEVWNALWVKSI